MTTTGATGSGKMLSMTIDGSPADAMSFYRRAAKTLGFRITAEAHMGNSRTLGAERKAGEQFSVTATASGAGGDDGRRDSGGKSGDGGSGGSGSTMVTVMAGLPG